MEVPQQDSGVLRLKRYMCRNYIEQCAYMTQTPYNISSVWTKHGDRVQPLPRASAADVIYIVRLQHAFISKGVETLGIVTSEVSISTVLCHAQNILTLS